MASMVFKNNARSTVADNPLAAGATTLNVAPAEGANFPSSFPFKLTIFDDSSYPDAGLEIVKCTGRSTDALTIVRAQEGTADVAHSLGERVAMLITAGHFNDATIGIITRLDAIETGGLHGINVETLFAGKTLTADTDEIYQFLDSNAANRIITLDTASAVAGDRWVIRNTNAFGDAYYLEIKQSLTSLDKCYSGGVKNFIFDGANWKLTENGTGEDGNDDLSLSIGSNSNGNTRGTAIGSTANASGSGVAIGADSNGNTNGVAIGYQSNGSSYGVGIGNSADGNNYGVAIGRIAKTNSNLHSVAIGTRSETERYSEIAHNINGSDTDQENNITICGWESSTVNATPVEIYCGGTASQRFTIRPSSVLAFRLIITARDNVAGHVGMWTVTNGVIKRDGSNNTAMATAATVTEVVDESGDWSVAVTADDTNEALIITVTGDAANTVQWVARLDGVETHF